MENLYFLVMRIAYLGKQGFYFYPALNLVRQMERIHCDLTCVIPRCSLSESVSCSSLSLSGHVCQVAWLVSQRFIIPTTQVI